MGLEADKAVGYERSGFKAASGAHPEFRTAHNLQGWYHPLGAHTSFLPFLPQNIFNSSSAEKTGKRHSRTDYLLNHTTSYGV